MVSQGLTGDTFRKRSAARRVASFTCFPRRLAAHAKDRGSRGMVPRSPTPSVTTASLASLNLERICVISASKRLRLVAAMASLAPTAIKASPGLSPLARSTWLANTSRTLAPPTATLRSSTFQSSLRSIATRRTHPLSSGFTPGAVIEESPSATIRSGGRPSAPQAPDGSWLVSEGRSGRYLARTS